MRRGESAHGTPGRLVLTLLVMVGLVSSPLAPLGSYASAQGMRLDSGQLDLLLQALRAERAGLPRDRFDVLEALELTDFTPEGAFAWVHDETRLVPYRGALVERPLLAIEPLLAAELRDARVALSVWPAGLSEDDRADADALIEMLRAEQHWYPVLQVGSTSYTDLEFTPACETATFTPPWGLGGAVRGLVGGAAGALFGGGPSDETVTALRLRLTLEAPSEGTLVLDRDVVDVLGSAKRAAGDLVPGADEATRLAWRLAVLGEREVLVTAGGLDPTYVSYLAADALVRAAPVIERAGAGEEVGDAPPVVAPGPLHALAVRLGDALPSSLYQGSANVLVRHNWFELAADGSLVGKQVLDVARNELMSYAPLGAAVTERLQHGVAATNAEALIAAQLCADSTAAGYCRLTGNAAELLAGRPGVEDWVVLTDPGEAAQVLSGWDADALARLQAELSAGYAALAPRTAPSDGEVAWWRVDPMSGGVIGVDARGYGNVAAEYVVVAQVISLGFCTAGALGGSNVAGGVVLCTLGVMAGGAAVFFTGHVAGVLAILAALLGGLGGLGAL